MREHKYRYYDNFINGFAYWNKGKSWYYLEKKRFENAHMFDWDKAEQYTGLKDKNGKDIYEGDIVEWAGHEVKNGKQVYPIRKHIIGGDNDKWITDLSVLRNIISVTRLEIIGNIHENPELYR